MLSTLSQDVTKTLKKKQFTAIMIFLNYFYNLYLVKFKNWHYGRAVKAKDLNSNVQASFGISRAGSNPADVDFFDIFNIQNELER